MMPSCNTHTHSLDKDDMHQVQFAVREEGRKEGKKEGRKSSLQVGDFQSS